MPLSKEARDTLCADALNTFLFDKVWNEPSSEFRTNIKPLLLKKGSFVGSFGATIGNIILPTARESYFVWAISASDFNVGLKLPTSTWVDTATITNTWNTALHMFGTNGAMFHKSFVYLQYDASREVIYVAALKRMVQKCITNDQLSDVYMSVYYDSDLANNVSMLSLEIVTSRNLQEYQGRIDKILSTLKKTEHLQVFKDGNEVTNPGASIALTVGSFIDIVIDENILFTFDVDITSSSENPVFLSSEDKTWKQLIHIPKAFNQDNKVITHNTCDIYIRKRFSVAPEGRFVHRVGGRSVSQVTHNDMAIPLFIIDAYRDYLLTQEVYVHVVVRIHDKNNTLIRDASYIDLLYSDVHDDKTLVNILCGKGPKEIPWWRADNLESSSYVKMFFDTPNVSTITHMSEYVKALGFYQVVNLLCQRVVDTIITDAFYGSLTFMLPILYTGMKVIPIVYLNKKRIDKEFITYTNNDDGTITVKINDLIHTKPGDKLTIAFFVNGNNSIYEFVPAAASASIIVPYDDVAIYLKHTSKDSLVLQGMAHSSDIVYTKLEKGENHFILTPVEGGTKITFNPKYEGETLLIQSAYCSYYQSFDLTDYTTAGTNIVIPVQSKLAGTVTDCPILNFKNVSVYFNGKYLVRNIDYFINSVSDTNGDLAFHEVVIQTMDAFEKGIKDKVDILFNVAEIEDISSGFAIDNKLFDATPVNLYFPNISMVHVDGLLERDVAYRGVHIDLLSGDHQQGAIFEIQTSVPKLVKDFILDYSSNEDTARLAIMNAYFYKLVNLMPEILLLEKKHRIYSTYMNTIISDVLNKDIIAVDDPDFNRMSDQIKPYAYLKDMDLCFTKIDKRFVDFYPQYINYAVAPEMKHLVDKLIAECMPKNTDPTVEVVYE